MGIGTDLDTLAQAIAALEGIRCASTDPAKITTFPGAWLQLGPIEPLTLDGHYSVSLDVVLVVKDNGYARSLDALSDALGPVLALLRQYGPTGPVQPTGLVLPASSTPLPALSVPVQITTTQE